MKVIFTGGGTGGHFYPIISVAQAINRIAKEKHLVKPEMYFFSPSPYNPGLLYDNNIHYKKSFAGKIRNYFSILNFFDLFKTAMGVISAVIDVFDIYPDVVFSKGGYTSFPTTFAARILRIPVVIHESDSVPGKANKWAGKFATRVAVSFKEAAGYFPHKDRIAYTGQPVRRAIMEPIEEGAQDFFGLHSSIPTIFIMGGSQGAQNINNAVIDALADLVEHYQIIHQTGQANIESVKETADAILLNNKYKERYNPKAYLNDVEMQMAAGAADVVVSRGGSSIFEIAAWGKPAIIIPIASSNGNHQVKNAFAYSSAGACTVIEENNLTPHVFIAQIRQIIDSPEIQNKMKESAKAFFKPNADELIAKEILSIALSHEELE